MRGKLYNFAVIGDCGRITPADAGKTFSVPSSSGRFQDHPRGCGENDILLGAFKQSLGSPPRMRGKLRDFPFPFDVFRITPADAGKTAITRAGYSYKRDHPRGCGENYIILR